LHSNKYWTLKFDGGQLFRGIGENVVGHEQPGPYASKGRVTRALINLKKQFGISRESYLNFELTRHDLSSRTGADHESFFRVMNEMLQENMIVVSGKKTFSADEAALPKLTGKTRSRWTG